MNRSRHGYAVPRYVWGGVLTLMSLPAMAQLKINTAEISARSVSLQCLDYEPCEGVCVWLNCAPFGCALVAVPKIRHFSPDVVVSAYHETGKNPWSEMGPLIAAAARAARRRSRGGRGRRDSTRTCALRTSMRSAIRSRAS